MLFTFGDFIGREGASMEVEVCCLHESTATRQSVWTLASERSEMLTTSDDDGAPIVPQDFEAGFKFLVGCVVAASAAVVELDCAEISLSDD